MKTTLIQLAIRSLFTLLLLSPLGAWAQPQVTFGPSVKDTNPTSTAVAALDLQNKTPLWHRNFTQQYRESLASPVASIREQTMQNIIVFATLHADEVDLSDTASDLFSIYRWDKNEAHRIMALMALRAIGDEYSMQRLGQHVAWERSDRVRRHTRAVLAEHYGQKK